MYRAQSSCASALYRKEIKSYLRAFYASPGELRANRETGIFIIPDRRYIFRKNELKLDVDVDVAGMEGKESGENEWGKH